MRAPPAATGRPVPGSAADPEASSLACGERRNALSGTGPLGVSMQAPASSLLFADAAPASRR